MKKKIASLLVLAAFVTTGIFAKPIDGDLSNKVLSSFSERFSEAKHVSWSKSDNYVKASFTLNNQVMFAYFTLSGEMVGVTRNILSTSLPLNLQTRLKKMATNNWISELFEMATDDQTIYYLTLENADQKTYLKSDLNNSWSVIGRIKKN